MVAQKLSPVPDCSHLHVHLGVSEKSVKVVQNVGMPFSRDEIEVIYEETSSAPACRSNGVRDGRLVVTKVPFQCVELPLLERGCLPPGAVSRHANVDRRHARSTQSCSNQFTGPLLERLDNF